MRFRFVPVVASCAVFAFAGSVSAARPKLPKPKLPIATWTTTSPLSDTVVSDSLRSGTAYSGGDAGVSKTTNGGVAWSGPIGPVFVNAIAVDQVNGNAVYVGTNNGANESTLYRSTDAGASYPFHNSLGGNEVAAIAIDPANASKIYLGDAGHAFANFIVRSDDAGASIAQTLLSPEGEHAKTIAIDPNRKNTIWVGISSDLWLTADGGLNWRHMSLGGTVNKITFDPDATKTALVSTDAGLYKVRNWIVTKLLSTGVAGAFFNPVGSGEIFAAGDGGVIHSTDEGQTWSSLGFGGQPTDLAVDASGSQLHVVAGTVYDYTAPVTTQFRNLYTLSFELEVGSDLRRPLLDAGRAWSAGNAAAACASLATLETLAGSLDTKPRLRYSTSAELLRQSIGC